MGRIKRNLNEWQFVFDIKSDYIRHPKVKKCTIGIFNIHTAPPEGQDLTKGQHYKGFLINFYI